MEKQLLMASGEIPFESDEIKVITAQQRFQELYNEGLEISEKLKRTK